MLSFLCCSLQAKNTRQVEDIEALQARDYSKVGGLPACGVLASVPMGEGDRCTPASVPLFPSPLVPLAHPFTPYTAALPAPQPKHTRTHAHKHALTT